VARQGELYAEARDDLYRRTSRLFLWLLAGQWVLAIAFAVAFTPSHVVAVLGVGTAINAGAITLIMTRPGWWGTRHVVAAVQMSWSALLIAITDGRIDPEFHVFGSLAILAFYRDWRVLPTAIAVLALEHVARDVEWWLVIEDSMWVALEVVVLAWSCLRGMRELSETADRQAHLENMEGTGAIPFDFTVGEIVIRVHRDDRPRVVAALAAFKGPVRAKPVEMRMVDVAGQVTYMRVVLGHRRGDRVRGVMFDVTREKQLETELRAAQQLESVGRLAAGVAHEINTPIQFVGDSVDFVSEALTEITAVLRGQRERDDDIDYIVDELPRALDRARDGVERVAKIVRSMKVFARPAQDVMEIADLNAAIQSTLVIAKNEYKYVADLDIDLGDVPGVPCHVGEFNQVILNLVINAAHAIAERKDSSGKRGKISIKTRHDDRFVVISIADNGNGIPESARDKIFEPFFTTKPVGKGTGQGLAIARSVIVDGHGGKLTYRTNVGVGTVFHIRMPIEIRQQGVAA
jgi:signal transduction histidine kinase